jgi:hypothetical protein
MNIDCNLKLLLMFKKNSKQRIQLLGNIKLNGSHHVAQWSSASLLEQRETILCIRCERRVIIIKGSEKNKFLVLGVESPA